MAASGRGAFLLPPLQFPFSAPQSQTSAQDCPYLLLEKGKHSSFGADAPALLPAPVSLAAIARPLSMAERDIHIADSSGLFLRLRVLLI